MAQQGTCDMLQDEYQGQKSAAPGPDGRPQAQTNLVERRNVPRTPAIKSAKIGIGAGSAQGVFNCLVLDESPIGVLVDFGTLVNLPEQVTLHMQGGANYVARRVWAVGTKAGLEFVGNAVATNETASRMTSIADVLQGQGVVAAVATLRTARFFDHSELRRVAEEAEAAYLRLEALPTGRRPI